MTMPDERTRSLRWAFEDLQKFSQDPSLETAHRSKAAELLLDYPTPDMVIAWIDSDASCIPCAAAAAIEGAGFLILSILCSEHGSSEMKRQFQFTLRHFPEPGTSQRWVAPKPGWTVRNWLLKEDHYR